jgi:outer membrane translocation and assembly module TamA
MNGRRIFPRFGTLALIASQVFLVRSSAQSGACPDSVPSQQKTEMRVIVDAAEFHGENSLFEAERAALAEEIKKTEFVTSSVTHDDWADEVAEVAIRSAFQNKGYFKVLVQGTPYLVRAEEHELHYVLRLDIESGPQYWFGDVLLVSKDESSLVFSEKLLRQQLELRQGDLFDVSKVRRALQNLTRLYSAKGYIDMVAEPETRIDNAESRIDLVLKIDEGKSYRISEIEFPALREQFQLPQSIGDTFDRALWDGFFKDNQSRLPPGASVATNMTVHRNTRESTVQIMLDLSSCQEPTLPQLPRPVLRTKNGS